VALLPSFLSGFLLLLSFDERLPLESSQELFSGTAVDVFVLRLPFFRGLPQQLLFFRSGFRSTHPFTDFFSPRILAAPPRETDYPRFGEVSGFLPSGSFLYFTLEFPFWLLWKRSSRLLTWRLSPLLFLPDGGRLFVDKIPP